MKQSDLIINYVLEHCKYRPISTNFCLIRKEVLNGDIFPNATGYDTEKNAHFLFSEAGKKMPRAIYFEIMDYMETNNPNDIELERIILKTMLGGLINYIDRVWKEKYENIHLDNYIDTLYEELLQYADYGHRAKYTYSFDLGIDLFSDRHGEQKLVYNTASVLAGILLYTLNRYRIII